MKIIRNKFRSFLNTYIKPIATDNYRSIWFYFAISKDPYIILTNTYGRLENVFYMSEQLADEKVYFLISFSWDVSTFRRSYYLKRCFNRHQKLYPQHEIIFLCNSEAEYQALQERNLKAVFINKNIFHDTEIFQIDTQAKKKYDAVLNARLAPFKRVELARKVRNLAIITTDPRSSNYARYGQKIRKLFPHASWLNYKSDGEYARLSAKEVNRALNESRVGLILSKKEGQNRTSIEYLLSGIPVVSTKSKGGRDVFFDEYNSIIVEDNPSAVARGVETLARTTPRPEVIREKTLEKIWQHRHRFCTLINDLLSAHGKKTRTTKEWFAIWPHQLKFSSEPKYFRKVVKSDIFYTSPFVTTQAKAHPLYPQIFADED